MSTTDQLYGATVLTQENKTPIEPGSTALWMPSKLISIAYSFTDQALAVGGGFLVNVFLARTQSKESFGTFALCYSIFIVLYGLYNAAILEPYTVYGSGRYRSHYSEYLRLMVRSSAIIGMFLCVGVLSAYFLLFRFARQLTSPALAGLGCSVGVLLSATFLRRSFYVQREPAFAAKASLVFFVVVCCGLAIVARAHVVDGFFAFMILALGWIAAGAVFGKNLSFGKPKRNFLELEPRYWREHWIYSRWALASILVFQLATQGYYWLLAAVLSVREVGELRAVYLVVSPIEQAFVAISFLVLPALSSRYAAGQMRDFFRLWKQNAFAVVGLTGLFALTVRIVGKPIVHILYAGKFDDLASLLYMLALSPVLIGTAGTMVNALNAAEKPRLVFCSYLSSGIATFVLGTPLVRRFGLRGAAFGILLSGSMLVGSLSVAFFWSIWKQSPQNTDRVFGQPDTSSQDHRLGADNGRQGDQ